MPGIDWFTGSALQQQLAGMSADEYPGDDSARRRLEERAPAAIDDTDHQDEWLPAAIVERPYTTLGPATIAELRKDEDEWERDNERWSWDRW